MKDNYEISRNITKKEIEETGKEKLVSIFY